MVKWRMRFFGLSLGSLAFACRGLAQDIPPPQIEPYTGPTVAYPETVVKFTVLAKEHQPGSLGNELEYELLAAPTNSSFSTFSGRGDEKFLFVNWQTPPRSAVVTTNQFVIQVTDHGTPPLSATHTISLVLMDLPPIRSIAKTNGVIVLEIADLVPGVAYLVQWVAAVPSTNWSALTFWSATAPSMTITDTNSSAAQRFYRLGSNGWCHGFGCS